MAATTLEKEIRREFEFNPSLEAQQVEVLCLYLMQKLSVTVACTSVEKRTWSPKEIQQDRQVCNIVIRQTAPHAELGFKLEQAYCVKDNKIFPTAPLTYQALKLMQTTPKDPVYDEYSIVSYTYFRGFSPEERTLLGKIEETVKTYFQYNF